MHSIPNNAKSMFLNPVSTCELKKIIESLKNTGAVGIDDISTKAMKLATNYICIPLTHIINVCFEVGVFPKILKIAKVIPLHKKGNKNNK
jgi:hypothetical protein